MFWNPEHLYFHVVWVTIMSTQYSFLPLWGTKFNFIPPSLFSLFCSSNIVKLLCPTGSSSDWSRLLRHQSLPVSSYPKSCYNIATHHYTRCSLATYHGKRQNQKGRFARYKACFWDYWWIGACQVQQIVPVPVAGIHGLPQVLTTHRRQLPSVLWFPLAHKEEQSIDTVVKV